MTGCAERSQLKELLEFVGGALFRVDREAVVLAWPELAERFFGRTASEALGGPAPRAIGGAQERLAAAIRAATEGARARLMGVFVEARGGAHLEVDLSIGPAGEGQGVAVLVVPRLRSQECAAGERRLAQVLDSIPTPIFFKDANGVYKGCNKAFEAYLGRPREHIVGHAVEDVAPPHLAHVYNEADVALMRSGEPQVYETQVRSPEGAERDVLFTKGVLRDERGTVEGLVGTMHDITARKQAERAVAASEERLHLVLDSVGEVFWDWDAASDALYLSPYFEPLVGIAPAGIATMRSFLRHVHRNDRRCLLRALEGDTFEREYRLRTASGEWKWVLSRAKVISRDAAGAVRRVVGSLADVSERKHLEQSLQASDRLASIGTLAAGVAHEINNPLCYVLANLDFVLGSLSDHAVPPGAGWDDVVTTLRDARAGAERMRTIVRDLRLLSRADEETLGQVDIESALDEALAMVRHELSHRAKLVIQYGGAPAVRGNAARLGQVFLNLLMNAIHAIPDGAAEMNQIKVATRLAGGEVIVEIRDSGCGIAPHVLPRVFDPFFTTKPIGTGTGLGLSISHRIVTSLGGRLEVESTPGHGSTFRVVLPTCGALPVTVKAVAAVRPVKRRRVLVIDDDIAVTAAIRRALSREHEIIVSQSAREWLERLAEGSERFDVILCDLMMPDLNGMTFYERLSHSAPEQTKRFLLMTGGAFGEEACAFLARFGNPVVEKPIDFTRLRDLIARSR
ncbi:MAG TPA: PAS domain S-box protein [Anaeromyxobacteraceae bacterium]|nr:PAS domain S-box protein [Anaeromyxobacteraceae bacterium]